MSLAPSAQNSVGSADRILAALVEKLTAQVEAGEAIDWPDLARRHPDHADRLRQIVPALQALAELDRSCHLGMSRAPEDEVEHPVGGTLGDFRIVRQIGRGGMGIVYEAEQLSLRRRVALKVLPFAATMDPRQLQRFNNEAQAAANLHHTNIVPVHFVGCERGVHFYAMQFINGQSLAQVIAELRGARSAESGAQSVQRGAPGVDCRAPTLREAPTPEDAFPRPSPLPSRPSSCNSTQANGDATPLTRSGQRGRDYYRQVAELGVQAAEALDHAHQVGIVHRDVKPGNLLLENSPLAPQPSSLRLWVTDFGLAQVRQGEGGLTMTGEMVGTLRYMSPEQALAKRVPIGHRTDVYSLGATLYELLTLHPAFAGQDRQELLRQIAFEEPKPPRSLNRALPAEFETIVLKAMEKNPADRYATAQELADDLRRLLRNEPIRARRPTAMQRARKWAARHRALVGAAALVLFLGVTMLAATIGYVASDQAARHRATEQAVTQALDESSSWQEKRRLPEALSVARRAAGLVAGGEADETLRTRVQARVDDLELVAELEEVRLQMTAVNNGHFDFELGDRLYGEALRRAGLDVERRPAEESGKRIQESSVAAELAAGLDHWALMRQKIRGQADPSWKHLLRVAGLADPDEWRGKVRDALGRGNRQALIDLAGAADVLRQGPSTLATLALGLRRAGAAEPARVLLEKAWKRHPGDFWVNEDLAEALKNAQPPRWDEAIRFHTAAVALRPQSPGAHLNLGVPLKEKGRLDEAIAECQEAIRLKKDYPEAHDNLGNVLLEKRLVDEAIAEYQEAIRLKKDFPEARNNLGVALAMKRRLDEAVAEFQEAVRLKKDYPEAHYNLGNALRDKGDVYLHEAIVEYQESIRLKEDNPRPHYNLGLCLLKEGRFAEGLTVLKRADELGSKGARWHFPSAQWVRKAAKLVALEDKLPKFLNGEAQPADAGDRIVLAQMCQQHKGLYAAAARFYADAFVAEPSLAEKLGLPGSRYDAACVAALAGCGQGNDATQTDDKERARLRGQALAWLRADLAAWRDLLEKEPAKAGAGVVIQMAHWLEDTDFAGVRGDKALAGLPPAERPHWQKLWQEVDALRQRAARPAGQGVHQPR